MPCGFMQATVRFISIFSLSQAGATPGGGLQLRCACFASAGSGYTINCRVNCMSFADRRLFFSYPLMPRGTGCVGRLMPAGHLLFYLRFAGGFLAKVRKRPLGLGTLFGSSWRLGHSCNRRCR